MDVWFEDTAMGRYVAQNEAAFFERHLQYFDGQTVVQQGGQWLRSSERMRSLYCRFWKRTARPETTSSSRAK